MLFFSKSFLRIAVVLLAAGVGSSGARAAPPAAAASYDPMARPAAAARAPDATTIHELTVHDADRQRDLRLRVYLPASQKPAPVILFSHGLGGSRTHNSYLGEHWSARGYVVVYLQHPGSDEHIWLDEKPRQRMRAMKKAANFDNLKLRLADVPAVLDQLDRWNSSDADTPLAHRLDLDHVGMCGHSFGALTTQYVSGQTMPRGAPSTADPRIVAALPMSPSPPRLGNAAKAFADVQIPWLLMTGTHDEAAIGNTPARARREVFSALPVGQKYELVLHEAEHNAFGDRTRPGETLPRNPNHHRVILALSTAFWDACLREDAEAQAWLNGDGPQTVMEPNDTWRRK